MKIVDGPSPAKIELDNNEVLMMHAALEFYISYHVVNTSPHYPASIELKDCLNGLHTQFATWAKEIKK